MNAKLDQKRINGADLHASTATAVAQFRRSDVIVAVRLQYGQRSETLDDLSPRFGAGEPLQQFLQDQSGGDHDITAEQRFLERMDFGFSCRSIAAQRQRPDAGINEQSHLRERSDL